MIGYILDNERCQLLSGQIGEVVRVILRMCSVLHGRGHRPETSADNAANRPSI